MPPAEKAGAGTGPTRDEQSLVDALPNLTALCAQPQPAAANLQVRDADIRVVEQYGREAGLVTLKDGTVWAEAHEAHPLGQGHRRRDRMATLQQDDDVTRLRHAQRPRDGGERRSQ